MDTLELYNYMLEMSLECRLMGSIPKRVWDKLLDVKVPKDSDVVQESTIKKKSMQDFKIALRDMDLGKLNAVDQMWRERILQALKFV